MCGFVLVCLAGTGTGTLAQDSVKAVPVQDVGATTIAPEEGPVLIELFSSRNCAFCPQAERYLQTLAADRGEEIIALSCHVDYFAVEGDTLATPVCTRRQKDYAAHLSTGPGFTPQMIMNGRYSVVGHKQARVDNSLKQALRDPVRSLEITKPDGAEQYRIHLKSSAAVQEKGISGRLLALTYRPPQKLEALAGPERGDDLIYKYTVSARHEAGQWGETGEASLSVALTDQEAGFVAVLQNPDTGQVLAIGRYEKPVAQATKQPTE